jgi:hypothetical protein
MNLSFNVGDDPANVLSNRKLFFGGLGIRFDELAIPGQVHSARIRAVTAAGSYPETDALLTSTPRVFLCVTFADCVPILLHDPVRKTVAAVHAGWRGTASGIAAGAVKQLGEEYGTRPQDLIGFLGPAAADCCYSVGEEVSARFDQRFVRRINGQPFLDLKGANLAQLADAGVDPRRFEVNPHCTISEHRMFHSHRRDGSKSGRMMAVIGIAG